MITVIIEFDVPEGETRDSIVETIKGSANNYQGVPGLIRKYYGVSADNDKLVGVYLWESREAADAFYTPDWYKMAEARWGAPTQWMTYDTPVVVDNLIEEVIAAA